MSKDFKLIKSDVYNKVILSSDKLNDRFNDSDLILAISKDVLRSNYLSVGIKKSVNNKNETLESFFYNINQNEANSELDQKYINSLKYFDEKEINLYGFEVDKEFKKHVNWLYWVYNLTNPNEWDIVFYISSIIPDHFKGVTREALSEIRCNIALKFYNSNQIDDFQDIDLIVTLLKALVNRLTYTELAQHALQLLKETQLSATRAAISQVMARNMSHNIGSHVLSKLGSESLVRQIYFKDKETKRNKNETSNKFNDWDFYQCINKLQKIDWKDDESTIYTPKETKSPNDALIAVLFDYLRKRMDYLADVTTSTPVIENCKFFFNDIVSPFIQNRALNDRISGISKFEYEIILCKPKNHQDHCRNQETASVCKSHINKFFVDNTNDFQVSIPNDVVGNHAFYTILENIIRNTAKHAKKPKNGLVEFKIKVQDANELYYGFKDHIIDTNLNEYYAVSIFDNCQIENNELNKLIDKQNTFLNESVLDKDTNQLRQSHWGLIEMDASAAYLRKIPVEQIDSDDYNIDDLTGASPLSEGKKLCILQAYPEQNKYLGYRFFIRKPHEVLIIQKEAEITNSIVENGQNIANLENEGIWIKNLQEIKDGIDHNKVFPHRLVVIAPEAIDIFPFIQYNPQFSRRILNLDHNKEIKSCTKLKKLWEMYYGEKPIYDTQPSIIDPNHRYAIEDHGTNYCMKLFGDDENFKNKFIEISFSLTAHFFNTKEPHETNKLFSWPLKVAILDERIQTFSNELFPIQQPDGGCLIEKKIKKDKEENNEKVCFHAMGGVPYSELFKNTNIIVPGEEFANLNAQSFDKEYINILTFIDTCLGNIIYNNKAMGNGLDDDPFEFIVIHLGVIEKLIASWSSQSLNSGKSLTYNKDKSDDVGGFIKREILKFHDPENLNMEEKKIYDKLVLTSGRGKPHNLPTDIRYINFSALSQYLTTQRNKFALTEILYSARNQKEN